MYKGTRKRNKLKSSAKVVKINDIRKDLFLFVVNFGLKRNKLMGGNKVRVEGTRKVGLVPFEWFVGAKRNKLQGDKLTKGTR